MVKARVKGWEKERGGKKRKKERGRDRKRKKNIFMSRKDMIISRDLEFKSKGQVNMTQCKIFAISHQLLRVREDERKREGKIERSSKKKSFSNSYRTAPRPTLPNTENLFTFTARQ